MRYEIDHHDDQNRKKIEGAHHMKTKESFAVMASDGRSFLVLLLMAPIVSKHSLGIRICV